MFCISDACKGKEVALLMFFFGMLSYGDEATKRLRDCIRRDRATRRLNFKSRVPVVPDGGILIREIREIRGSKQNQKEILLVRLMGFGAGLYLWRLPSLKAPDVPDLSGAYKP
jgi:hypothetical protein